MLIKVIFIKSIDIFGNFVNSCLLYTSIPLVGDIKELKYVKKFVVETADAEIAASDIDLKYEVCLLYTSRCV